MVIRYGLTLLIVILISPILFSQITNYTDLQAPDFGLDEPQVRGFGEYINNAGDFNGDGIEDLIIKTRVYKETESAIIPQIGIALLNESAEIMDKIIIHSPNGSETLYIEDFGNYGSLAVINDLDGDGISEIVAGNPYFKINGEALGAVEIFFPNASGEIKHRIRHSGDLLEPINKDIYFGRNVNNIGDQNGDGIDDIAVAAPLFNRELDNDYNGAVMIGLLDSLGNFKQTQIIPNTYSLISWSTVPWAFAEGIIGGHDMNLDGINDLIISSPHAIFEGEGDKGHAVILFLDENLMVKDHKEIHIGHFPGGGVQMGSDPHIGSSLTFIDDLTNDGIPEFLIGANWSNHIINEGGEIYIASIDIDGNVKIDYLYDLSKEELELETFTQLGKSMTTLADNNGDGVIEIVASAEEQYDVGFIRIMQSNFDYFNGLSSTESPDHLLDLEVNVYPNPVHDVITITSEQIIQSINVLDLNGRKCLELNPNSNQFNLSLGHLGKGQYIIELISEIGVGIKKIVLE